jgi:hypothetical protein
MKKLNIELVVDKEPTPDTNVYAEAPPNGQRRDQISMEPNSRDTQNAGSIYVVPSYQDSVVDLDMDAIIHSFLNEQQAPYLNNTLPQSFPRMYHPGVLPNVQQQFAGLAQGWNTLDLAGDESFDDTLFGEFGILYCVNMATNYAKDSTAQHRMAYGSNGALIGFCQILVGWKSIN